MSRFIPIELHHASRLLNHGPTVMITSFDEQSQRRNIMAAAWSMPVEFEPPRVAIVVDKSTWTRELIERNGKFGIVIPGVAATNWTWAVGSVSGREEDKFNCYGIPVVKGPVLGLPLVEEKCLAWMECRLLPATSAQQKYDTLFGEVVSAAADARVFVEGRWQFDDDKLNTLHHLGAGTFVTSGKRVTAGLALHAVTGFLYQSLHLGRDFGIPDSLAKILVESAVEQCLSSYLYCSDGE